MFASTRHTLARSVLAVALVPVGVFGATVAAQAAVAPASERSIVHLELDYSAYVEYPAQSGERLWSEKQITATYQCTGFFVSANADILTAAHCLTSDDEVRDQIATEFLIAEGIQDQADIDAMLPELAVDTNIKRVVFAYQPKGIANAVLDEDGMQVQVVDEGKYPTNDLALLRVNNLGVETPALPVATEAPEVSTQVTSVGFPGSLSDFTSHQRASYKSGEISSYQTMDGVSFAEISSAMNAGMSGGPTLTADGRVIGVNSFGIADDSDDWTNFVTDTRQTYGYLVKNGVTPIIAGAAPATSDQSAGTTQGQSGSTLPTGATEKSAPVATASTPSRHSVPWVWVAMGGCLSVVLVTAVVAASLVRAARRPQTVPDHSATPVGV